MDELRAEAEAMTGPAAMPRENGDVVFYEPWQGRTVALALETVRGLDVPWEEFRQRLIAAIADDPTRPYYNSWLLALEQLVIEHRGAEIIDLDAHRMRAAAYRTDDADHNDVDVFPVTVDGPTLATITAVLGEPLPPRVAHLELHRVWLDGAPNRWLVRAYDGGGQVLHTVALGEPSTDQRWDELRARLLHLPRDAVDHQ